MRKKGFLKKFTTVEKVVEKPACLTFSVENIIIYMKTMNRFFRKKYIKEGQTTKKVCEEKRDM